MSDYRWFPVFPLDQMYDPVADRKAGKMRAGFIPALTRKAQLLKLTLSDKINPRPHSRAVWISVLECPPYTAT